MTQPLFEVKTHVSRESCRAQARAKAGQHNRMTWVVTIMTAFAVAILWAIGSFHAWWVTALLMLLVLDNLLRIRLTGWRMYSARNESVREVRMIFDAEGMTVYTSVEESRIGYDKATGLFADGRWIVILVKHHTPLAVHKADVPGGQADALVRMLAERTGLQVRKLCI